MNEVPQGEKRQSPVFVEKQTYYRRRLRDAARLLPVLAVVLFALPLLWPTPGDLAAVDTDLQPVSMSGAFTYIFLVWAVLIATTGWLGNSSKGWGQSAPPAAPEQD